MWVLVYHNSAVEVSFLLGEDAADCIIGTWQFNMTQQSYR